MNLKNLIEELARYTDKRYYLYAGYHEVYLTDHQLNPPFIYQAENIDLNQLINDNISETDEKGNMLDPSKAFSTDDCILFDKSIMQEVNKTDMFKGMIEQIDDENDATELRQNNIIDLSKYWN